MKSKKIIFIFFISIILSFQVTLWANQSDSVVVKVRIDQKPVIQNVIPADKSKFTEQDIVSISVTAQGADGDILEYRFSIDNIVKQTWSSSSNYNWQAIAGDKGMHSIKVEARDSVSEADPKTIQVYIFRKPIEPPLN